jgi:hypothetical protein
MRFPATVSMLLLLLVACATRRRRTSTMYAAIFRDKRGWYDDARDAQKAWGVPIPVLMAFVHQESRFVARAKPPRRKILGFIPGPRPSDSYGYSQALQSTWDEYYQRSAGALRRRPR